MEILSEWFRYKGEGHKGESFALPPCPSDQNQRYHNCFGTYTFANGHKCVGEFKDNTYHGKGIYIVGILGSQG